METILLFFILSFFFFLSFISFLSCFFFSTELFPPCARVLRQRITARTMSFMQRAWPSSQSIPRRTLKLAISRIIMNRALSIRISNREMVGRSFIICKYFFHIALLVYHRFDRMTSWQRASIFPRFIIIQRFRSRWIFRWILHVGNYFLHYRIEYFRSRLEIVWKYYIDIWNVYKGLQK